MNLRQDRPACAIPEKTSGDTEHCTKRNGRDGVSQELLCEQALPPPLRPRVGWANQLGPPPPHSACN
eukprot:13058699-Alexandrium_andersonii.AAC.1